MLYSYKEAISGFAARLTPEEVRGMEKMNGFLRANPSKRLQLQTTYTHNLLNLSTLFGAWSTSNSFFGEGIIIGVLDTGIHFPHPSFADTGMPPRPRGWNASCYLPRRSCNGKVIGAQSFKQGNTTIPPTDIDQGHGTHVAGIAAGNFVDNAEVLGQAPGRAAGMAPKAFISVYKVCWKDIGCESSGILAGIDKAIQDGVHILQMSFGARPPYLPNSFDDDEVAVATYSAMQKGIFPCTAAGSNGRSDQLSCKNNSLNGFNVRNKIVMCYVGDIENTEKKVISSGMLEVQRLFCYKLYTNSKKITFGGTIFGVRPAPALAYFSSRGPARYNGNIVKPDVTAPGVNILAAWPVEVGPFPSGLKRKTFNFLSGTSMATPHVSGIVALIMSKLKNDNKRQWSTSEIQSALITTANTFDLDGRPIFDEATLNNSANILQRGAGQVNVTNAMDPGLLYNIETDDYVAYLCGIFFNSSQTVQIFTKNNTQCTRSISGDQLNYASIGVQMRSRLARTTISRTVTNVGDAREIYNAKIIEPPFVKIYLSQYRLSFTRLEQQITYSITFTMNGTHPGSGVIGQGELSWVSSKHTVTSPIYIAF
ncbi:subtilisin-like protease [Dioscorea cayenensis subsp. rotundata]|uniref:Subtilisin-like protease n=1 Tax=Dioscorea cayennensis subsp. rotundata TaxID=55577 RepID=A0AB40B0B2_DIOCR|nr:subtilisin-like protease [Dioscorea cayenensis subsp. rotundata]